MSTITLARMIGAVGWYRTVEGLHVAIRITDAKCAYGVRRYLVTPIAGTGARWINADRFNPTIDGATDEKGVK